MLRVRLVGEQLDLPSALDGRPTPRRTCGLATRDTSATALPNLKSTLLRISRKRDIGQGGSLLQYILLQYIEIAPDTFT